MEDPKMTAYSTKSYLNFVGYTNSYLSLVRYYLEVLPSRNGNNAALLNLASADCVKSSYCSLINSTSIHIPSPLKPHLEIVLIFARGSCIRLSVRIWQFVYIGRSSSKYWFEIMLKDRKYNTYLEQVVRSVGPMTHKRSLEYNLKIIHEYWFFIFDWLGRNGRIDWAEGKIVLKWQQSNDKRCDTGHAKLLGRVIKAFLFMNL